MRSRLHCFEQAAQNSEIMRMAHAAVVSSRAPKNEALDKLWKRFSGFALRLQWRGIARAAVELACEGLTLTLCAGLAACILAAPAFRLTNEQDPLKQMQIADRNLDRVAGGERSIGAVALEEYPDYLIKAVLATEDRRFYQHFGIDPEGAIRALIVDARSKSARQGGSTITQQLAKNLFLSKERTIMRKINEAFWPCGSSVD